MSLTIMCFSQERVKKVIDLKNGTSVAGFVMEQEDGSYLLETEAGDVLFYTAEEVRSVRMQGEENKTRPSSKSKITPLTEGHILKRNGFSLTFADSGDDLLPEQVSTSFWNDYRKASKGKRAGMWIMIGGGGVVIIGSALSAIKTVEEGSYWNGNGYTTYHNVNSSPVGAIVASVGAGVAIFGAVKFFSGNAKLGKLAKQYNSQHGYSSELSLEVVPTGLAFKYSF